MRAACILSVLCMALFSGCMSQVNKSAEPFRTGLAEAQRGSEMSDAELKCGKTLYHAGYEDEIIICATSDDDISKMHQLYEDAAGKLDGQDFDTEEAYEEALIKVQPKFHVIYPVTSFDELPRGEEAYSELVTYATTFEVQFVRDIPDNASEKYIRLNVVGHLPHTRVIFSGTKSEPTVVRNLMIRVSADTVIVGHLNFVHRLPASAIRADVVRSFLARNVVIENAPEVQHAQKFAEEPLIFVHSTQSAPFDVTIEHSVFKNNGRERIFSPGDTPAPVMKSIALSDVELTENYGGMDIFASDSLLIDGCTVSQPKSAPAFLLRSPETGVVIRNSRLSGGVIKYSPPQNSSSARIKPIVKTNNVEADDAEYEGWQ